MPESAWMEILYFFAFWHKHSLKLIFTCKNYLSLTLNIIYCIFCFMNFFGRMKLNFSGSEIRPDMACESSQEVVKPKSNFHFKKSSWDKLLFRKSWLFSKIYQSVYRRHCQSRSIGRGGLPVVLKVTQKKRFPFYLKNKKWHEQLWKFSWENDSIRK